MPIIVNPYNAPGSIANSLASLGESMFGNEAQKELIRQNALKTGRENTSAVAGAQAYRDNNRVELGAQSYLGGRSGADANSYIAGRAGTAANGNVDDPNLATALTAEGKFAGSPMSQKRSQDNTMAITQMQTDRANQLERYKFDNTYENMTAPDGSLQPVPRSQVTQKITEGYRMPKTKEQVEGQLLDRRLNPQPAAQAPTPVTAPGAPPADPNAPVPAALPGSPPAGPQQQPAQAPNDPMVQQALIKAGYATAPEPYRDAGGTNFGLSEDHGQTVKMGDGSVYPTNGTWAKATEAEHLQYGNAAKIRQQVLADKPIDTTNYANVGAGKAAGAASGLFTSGVPRLANAVLGDTQFIPAALHAAGQSGRISPDTTDALTRMEMVTKQGGLANDAYNGIRPSVHNQKIVEATLPDYGALHSPYDATASVGNYIRSLQDRGAQLAAAIQNPTSPPADVEKLHVAYRANRDQLEFLMKDYGAPPAAAAPAQQQPQPKAQAQQPQAAPQAQPNQQQINLLHSNPTYKDQFDAKFGAGASARVLGGQ